MPHRFTQVTGGGGVKLVQPRWVSVSIPRTVFVLSVSCNAVCCSAVWCLQVVDETDRMLRQAYQDWLPNLTAALAKQQRPLHDRVVRIVVSATLTRDPSKVERLGLHCPRYIAMSSQDHRSGSKCA